MTRVRALGRANAGNDLFAGLRSASQLGGVRQQGQYLASDQFLVIRVARPHDDGLRQEWRVDDLADVAPLRRVQGDLGLIFRVHTDRLQPPPANGA